MLIKIFENDVYKDITVLVALDTVRQAKQNKTATLSEDLRYVLAHYSFDRDFLSYLSKMHHSVTCLPSTSKSS